jgi:hypothetical protein
VVIKQSKSKCMMAGAFTSAPVNHARTEWRLVTSSIVGLILRRFELGEFFFRVSYVGFVRAAEFKQSLLTP